MPDIGNETLVTATPPTFEEEVLTAIYEQWSATWGKSETLDLELSDMLAEQPQDHVETVLDAMSGYLALIALDVADADPLPAYRRARQAVAETVLAGEIRSEPNPEPDADTVVDLLSERALEAAHNSTAVPEPFAENLGQPAVPASRHNSSGSAPQADHGFGEYIKVYGQLLSEGLEPERALPLMTEASIAIMLGHAPKEPDA